MKKIFLTIFLAFFFLFFLKPEVHARIDSKPLCEKYGITFPVKDLGGCTDYASCRDFCKDPLHQDACSSFTKSKGLDKITKAELENQEKLEAIVAVAKAEFNCTGKESCQAFCAQKPNFAKCANFAKKNDVVGGFIDDPGDKAVLDKASKALGCRNQTECENFCEKKENQSTCTKFASEVGLSGGTQKIGPGGCRSQESCSTFCQNTQNQNSCSGFVPVKAQKELQKPGPGGCTSQQDCQKYCNNPQNYQECSKFSGAESYFSGPGGCTDSVSCAEYCRKNYTDAKCLEQSEQYGGFKGPGGCTTESSCTDYCTQNYTDPECTQYGDKSGFQGPGGCTTVESCTSYCKQNYQDPECEKYAGQSGGGFKGPDGCTDMASCSTYCQSNFQDPECQKFGGGEYPQQ